MRIGVLESDAPNAWALPWKLVCSERLADVLFDLLDGAYGRADRGAGQEVEGNRHRRELALVVHHEWRDFHHRLDQRR
jgi:hypothetical protein